MIKDIETGACSAGVLFLQISFRKCRDLNFKLDTSIGEILRIEKLFRFFFMHESGLNDGLRCVAPLLFEGMKEIIRIIDPNSTLKVNSWGRIDRVIMSGTLPIYLADV